MDGIGDVFGANTNGSVSAKGYAGMVSVGGGNINKNNIREISRYTISKGVERHDVSTAYIPNNTMSCLHYLLPYIPHHILRTHTKNNGKVIPR